MVEIPVSGEEAAFIRLNYGDDKAWSDLVATAMKPTHRPSALICGRSWFWIFNRVPPRCFGLRRSACRASTTTCQFRNMDFEEFARQAEANDGVFDGFN